MRATYSFPLERLRLETGLSKRKIAIAVGVDPAFFTRLEQQTARMTWDLANAIAEVCGYRVELVKVERAPINIVGMDDDDVGFVREVAESVSSLLPRDRLLIRGLLKAARDGPPLIT